MSGRKFLQLSLKSGFDVFRLPPKLIHTPNTFENEDVIHYDLRIFTRIFSTLNQQEVSKNILPGRKNNILTKNGVLLKCLLDVKELIK